MATQAQLDEAIAARHALMTGQKMVSINVSTGGGSRSVSYSQVNLKDLNAYISQLQRELAGVTSRRSRISYMVPD